MGRFTSVPQSEVQVNTQPGQFNINDWPKTFANAVIGIERNDLIVTNPDNCHTEGVQVNVESLEAIRIMRLKGYRVVLFSNEYGISIGKITTKMVDESNSQLMSIFGQAGIFSIDGLYYSTTNVKEDIYSMPNNGMLKKCEKEMKTNFKTGYFVGDKIHDLKVGNSCGAKPILIKTKNFEETEKKLSTFANRELKKKTIIFNSLLEFAKFL
jgi:HAD superfamily hydrolase (TIGR01662 family)